MIILDKWVYVKTWAGTIDRIVFYNKDKNEFTVKCIDTGKVRTHSTALDCLNVSFDLKDFKSNNDSCIEYLIRLGITNLDRLPFKFTEMINNTSIKIAELISKLNDVNSEKIKSIVIEKNYIDSSPDIDGIINLANETLITSNGQCHWDNIDKVKKAGFNVFAGEKDSFGWLTGCISTKKGIIVYG